MIKILKLEHKGFTGTAVWDDGFQWFYAWIDGTRFSCTGFTVEHVEAEFRRIVEIFLDRDDFWEKITGTKGLH